MSALRKCYVCFGRLKPSHDENMEKLGRQLALLGAGSVTLMAMNLIIFKQQTHRYNSEDVWLLYYLSTELETSSLINIRLPILKG